MDRFSPLALGQDEDLLRRVAAHVHSRLGSRIHEFRLHTHADGLILEGSVGTYYGKQLAQAVAAELSGCVIAANEIQVV
jgi:hypothetical protein